MPITQLLPTNKKFSHIVHIADIHIRLTKRHDEYKAVFHELFEDIYKTPPTTAIFILGDIVNSKLDLSPECVDLAAEFLRDAADLRPTILITGNHDTNLTNRSRMDSLSPVVDALNHPNLFYLKESGLYGLGNICINNYSVFDEPDKYLKGEDIPQIYRNQYEYFIATYHGVVNGAATDIGFTLINPSVTIDMFDNHDIVLMGDVHKKQDLQSYDYETGKPIIHYAGSLIQQKHDEPLKGHGYSFWNLETREYFHIDISNEYGFFTVVVENGVIISDLTDIPQRARIRFQLKNTTQSEVKTVITEIKNITDVVEISYDRLDKTKSLTRIPSTTGNDVLGDINDKKYQTLLITNYLKTRLNVVEQELINGVIKINDEVNDSIKKDDFVRNIRWIPIKFEWENMFSYGENNVIDFTKAKDLVGLFAGNTVGKSSIFSALTFCLFDKCERVDEAKQVMNDKKTTFKCKFEFEMDSKRYFIQRDAKTDKKGKVKVDVRFWKLEDGKEVDLNGEQRRNTNEIIREYLGSYDDFVLTSLSVQNGKNNQSIIDMGNADRKDLFAQFMGLTMFDRLYTEGNERLKERLILLKSYRNDDYEKRLLDCQNLLEQADILYKSERESLILINQQRDLLQQMIVDTTKKLIKIDVNIPYYELSKLALEKANIMFVSKKIEVVETEKNIEVVAGQLKEVEDEIVDLENKKVGELSNTFRELGNKKRDIEYKREQMKSDYRHNLEILGNDIHSEYDPNCQFCVKRVGEVAEKAEKARQQNLEIQTKASKLLIELKEIEKQISEIEWSFQANLKLMGLYTKRNDVIKRKIYLLDSLNKMKDAIRNYEEEIKLHEKNIELYNKNKEAIQFNELVNDEIVQHNTTLSNVSYSYQTKTKTLMDINSKASICENQITELTSKIKEIKLIEQEYKLYELYCQSVSRDGIPFDVITATVPEVQNEVNSILSQITEFTALFETDGKNIVPYIVYNDRKWGVGLISGFERFALSLAIRVSLLNISNLPRSNFLILDEGFSVMDSENLSNLPILFTHLKSFFDFIIIISHNDTIKDFVDSHIEITKDGDCFSHVNYI